MRQAFKIRNSPNVLVFGSELSVFHCATAIWFKVLYLRWCCVISSQAKIGLAGRRRITLVVSINIQGQYAALYIKITRVAN
jgi:hypothetical protein